MAKSLFKELGGKYERQGDYLIPSLTVSAEKEQPIGIWGQRHLDYLKHYRKVTYTNLLTSKQTDRKGTNALHFIRIARLSGNGRISESAPCSA